MLLERRMKFKLLEDILYTLNQLPDRKVKGKDFTTYDLAKQVEVELELINALEQSPSRTSEDRTFRK